MLSTYLRLSSLMLVGLFGCSGGFQSPVPPDRSWYTGKVAIAFLCEKDSVRIDATLSFPDVPDDYFVNYVISAVADGRDDLRVAAGHPTMQQVRKAEGRVAADLDIGMRLANHQFPLDGTLLVMDYEIWTGPPGTGRLLVKSSLMSDPCVRARKTGQVKAPVKTGKESG